jgi:hypothetical protein
MSFRYSTAAARRFSDKDESMSPARRPSKANQGEEDEGELDKSQVESCFSASATGLNTEGSVAASGEKKMRRTRMERGNKP